VHSAPTDPRAPSHAGQPQPTRPRDGAWSGVASPESIDSASASASAPAASRPEAPREPGAFHDTRGTSSPTPRYSRYVAIGDSSTEGLDDPDERGGYRGWANRLAGALAEHAASRHETFRYANLAIRGRRTAQIRAEQLGRAIDLGPDLATVFAGTNDAVARHFDVEAFARDLDAMFGALRRAGATVLTFTMPDLAPVMPLARRLAPRLSALNEAIRHCAAAHQTLLVDFAQFPVASDPRLWSEDRLHANAAGHARIAAALAARLALPGSDASWQAPLPQRPAPGQLARARAELRWIGRHLLPWVLRHLRGRSSGDGVSAKRPELLPFP
jgi:lysophospholipase L1-like esterase